jgi:hypothetical protein
MCFHEYFLYLVLDWKGNRVFGKDNASTQLHRYYLLFVGILPSLHIGINFHSYLYYQWGENIKRALEVSVLAINAKGGESI